MELNEMEKKLLFQVEGDYQTKILNELYMTVRYSNNSEQREAAEGLMAKLRVLSNAECMDLVKDMSMWELIGLWLETNIINLCMWVLSIVIFVIVYGRMIEIYLTVSLAPIPFSTMANREWGQMGTGYLRSLFALGFQGFLILICVAIYAVLVQSIPSSGDVHGAIWGTAGYTVLLAFALFKTGSLSKSIFNAR